tara:strand:+ start:3241 stop:3363 length:123 start_codon:yes stop_codon:yes gene_type:complete
MQNTEQDKNYGAMKAIRMVSDVRETKGMEGRVVEQVFEEK